MQKINFNDVYGLTDLVLSGKKTQTRRIINIKDERLDYLRGWNLDYGFAEFGRAGEEPLLRLLPHYYVGEEVVVAQSYRNVMIFLNEYLRGEFFDTLEKELCEDPIKTAGWTNKMFVRAELMPHRIRIKQIRLERLQSISDEDCLAEGCEGYLDKIASKGYEKYEQKAAALYYISGNSYDQSFCYCENCAKKIAKRHNKEKGLTERDSDCYIVDGGWGSEEETSKYCEECGKPLLYDYIPTYLDDELAEIKFNDTDDLYLLYQILHECGDEARSKAVKRFARQAYAALIDKISGKGTWGSNLYVWVYDFELVK